MMLSFVVKKNCNGCWLITNTGLQINKNPFSHPVVVRIIFNLGFSTRDLWSLANENGRYLEYAFDHSCLRYSPFYIPTKWLYYCTFARMSFTLRLSSKASALAWPYSSLLDWQLDANDFVKCWYIHIQAFRSTEVLFLVGITCLLKIGDSDYPSTFLALSDSLANFVPTTSTEPPTTSANGNG